MALSTIKHIRLIAFFFFFLLALKHVVAQCDLYDPSNLGEKHNFDPRKANPEGRITCLGKPELPLPKFEDWNPLEHTLQELCAEPQYGGMQRRHAGGRCQPWSQVELFVQLGELSSGLQRSDLNPPISSFGSIKFDERSKRHPILSNPRFLRYCKQRCYCTADEKTPGVQPNGIHYEDYPNHPMIKNYFVGYGMMVPYQMSVDVVDDFKDNSPPCERESTQLRNHHWPRKRPENSRATFIIADSELASRLQWAYTSTMYIVATDPGNDIVCDGEIGDLVPPAPHTRADFKSMQELCAMASSGGNRTGNAGGYCHRNNAEEAAAEGYQQHVVWFSDEMTPRVEWTWGGSMVHWAMDVRFRCRKHCRCAADTGQPERLINLPIDDVWRLTAKLQISKTEPDGSGVTISTNQKSSGSGQAAGPSGSKEGSTTETFSPNCGPRKNQYCPSTWSVEKYGAIPYKPPPMQSNQQCDLSCSNNIDCVVQSSKECPLYRRCMVDPKSVKETVLGSVSTVLTYTVATCLQAKRGKGLNGRVVDAELEKRKNWPCACNSTYVSRSCCEIEDGIVFEDSSGTLGILDQL